MSYFAVDDGAHNHPKILRAKNAAVGLWMRIGSYVGQQLLDGHVPGEIAKSYGTAPQIKNLLDVGLWHAHGHTCPRCPQPSAGDYYMHDYAESANASRAEVLARREKQAAKKRQQRGQAPRRPPGPPPWQPEFDDEPPADDEAAPPPEDKPQHGGRPPRPSASRIAPGWEPSLDDVNAAQAARQEAGQRPLTEMELARVTRHFRRRQLDNGTTAVEWGGRWQQWAENERVEDQGPGGIVVPFAGGAQQTRGQQQREGLARLLKQTGEV